MRQVALSWLWLKLDQGRNPDPERWYEEFRETSLSQMFPFLVEDQDSKGSGSERPRFYTLSPDPQDSEVAVLEVHELKSEDVVKLPFNQPSGSQSAALGPVIKRTPPAKKSDPPGPSRKIQQTTLKAFLDISKSNAIWSPYFRLVWECWTRPKLRFQGEEVPSPNGAYETAINRIDERQRVLLVFRSREGKLPGEVPEYVEYLQDVLASTKYATASIPSSVGKACAQCGRESTTVYPNALRGAGLNIGNLDRQGAFPNLDSQLAWKYFALCVGCADLLYVYWHHIRRQFEARVAGEKALILPTLNVDPKSHKKLLDRVKTWAESSESNSNRLVVREQQLLHVLGSDLAVNNLSIVWADFGQRMEDVRGIVTDILPSRLGELAQINVQIQSASSPLFPKYRLEGFVYDLSLSILRNLLNRPGGRKSQARNESRRLFNLRRDIVDSIYHRTSCPLERLWREVYETARCHWDETISSERPVYGLLYEGWSEKKSVAFLTLAGWIRHLAQFLNYCRMTGVSPMPNPLYQPTADELKPYFTSESALDSPSKAFAFILGILYGKLLQVQAERDVNVGANALTWLKRLTLSGKDLPELYVKVREKLLVYGTEGSSSVRSLLAELGRLGVQLGTKIALDETETCYFLLLGQSLTTQVLPSKKSTGA